MANFRKKKLKPIHKKNQGTKPKKSKQTNKNIVTVNNSMQKQKLRNYPHLEIVGDSIGPNRVMVKDTRISVSDIVEARSKKMGKKEIATQFRIPQAAVSESIGYYRHVFYPKAKSNKRLAEA
jgi:uncharacterized protein (DUF433 family)